MKLCDIVDTLKTSGDSMFTNLYENCEKKATMHRLFSFSGWSQNIKYNNQQRLKYSIIIIINVSLLKNSILNKFDRQIKIFTSKIISYISKSTDVDFFWARLLDVLGFPSAWEVTSRGFFVSKYSFSSFVKKTRLIAWGSNSYYLNVILS